MLHDHGDLRRLSRKTETLEENTERVVETSAVKRKRMHKRLKHLGMLSAKKMNGERGNQIPAYVVRDLFLIKPRIGAQPLNDVSGIAAKETLLTKELNALLRVLIEDISSFGENSFPLLPLDHVAERRQIWRCGVPIRAQSQLGWFRSVDRKHLSVRNCTFRHRLGLRCDSLFQNLFSYFISAHCWQSQFALSTGTLCYPKQEVT